MRISTLSRPLIDQVRSGSRSTLGWLRTRLAALFSWLNGLWQTLSPEQKWSLLGIFAAIIIVSTIALLRTGASTSSETAPLVSESVEPVHPAFPPISEPLATLLSEGRPSFSAQSAKSIDLVRINETVFLITEASIVDLTTKESVPTPEPIRLVAAMDDLDSLFVLSTSDTLYIYSVSTKQFAKNTLPATGKIDQMGAYLTYLYTLDQSTGNISRFPRAEGGFGTPTNWLKETVSLAPEGSMAVYENIALTLKNKEPALFSRGKRANTTFAGTTTLVTTNALAFDQRSGDLLVLDRANKRIVRWSATGTLLAQYFHESLEGAEVISLSRDGTELIVVQQGTTSFWKI